MATSIPGPDGFVLTPGDPLSGAHVRLNDYLHSQEQRDTARTPFDVAPWRKLPKREIPAQVKAVLGRIAWLDQHDAELENAHVARLRLATLLRVLYTIKAPHTEQDLRELLELTTPLLGRIAPYGSVERVLEYIQGDDLTPELCQALRHFQANLREEM